MTAETADAKTIVLDPKEHWHLDKKVPAVLLLGILVQAIYFTNYIGDLKSKVSESDRRLLVLESQKVGERLAALESQMADNKSLLLRMDAKLDRISEQRGTKHD